MKPLAFSLALVVLFAGAAFACGPDKGGTHDGRILTNANSSGSMYSYVIPRQGDKQTTASQPGQPTDQGTPTAQEPGSDGKSISK